MPVPFFTLLGLAAFIAVACPGTARAQIPNYYWSILIPENDTRPPEVRAFDESANKQLVRDMNKTEDIFQHRLLCQQLHISQLLSSSAPLCELDFDPVHPLILTAREKVIVEEYFERGGVLLLRESVYPYSPQELSGIKQWPIIDFLTMELPADDHDFIAQKITEKHPLFHQYYATKLPEPELRALMQFPNLPDLTLLTHKGHPCAFVYASYFCDGERWITLSPPYPTEFTEVPEDYALWVNYYVYASMH